MMFWIAAWPLIVLPIDVKVVKPSYFFSSLRVVSPPPPLLLIDISKLAPIFGRDGLWWGIEGLKPQVLYADELTVPFKYCKAVFGSSFAPPSLILRCSMPPSFFMIGIGLSRLKLTRPLSKDKSELKSICLWVSPSRSSPDPDLALYRVVGDPKIKLRPLSKSFSELGSVYKTTCGVTFDFWGLWVLSDLFFSGDCSYESWISYACFLIN